MREQIEFTYKGLKVTIFRPWNDGDVHVAFPYSCGMYIYNDWIDYKVYLNIYQWLR